MLLLYSDVISNYTLVNNTKICVIFRVYFVNNICLIPSVIEGVCALYVKSLTFPCRRADDFSASKVLRITTFHLMCALVVK